MEFLEDILTLEPSATKEINLIGARLPNSKDVYFRSKQKEIIEQYSAARIFIVETENEDWEHWFDSVEDATTQQYFQSTFKAYFYETALMFYNIVVDLSWVICYMCAEFALTQKGERVDFGKIQPIEEAYEMMRSAEKLVTNPNAETNPFEYLRNMCPEFATAIDMIIDFWNTFGNSNIRYMYNFCKHKGKPAYIEIEDLKSRRFMGFYQESRTGNRIQLASDASDVRMRCSLDDAIKELLQFDNEALYPYISNLFEELEKVLSPSPFV